MNGSIIVQEGVLYGSISSVGNLSGLIKTDGNLTGNVFITVDREYYMGINHVVPKIESQILLTSDKIVSEDITVEGIPIYEVSNPQGGNTVIIGG